ncbi:DNA topoisomerase IB [Mycobacterium sp. ST-F2]|uniref:DNA topoisomerase IB n=1 Tax=Mycobacterium sp. ST-F2 TaxID=1490484 RepID=UPI0025708EA8|nr:DNA topoisomerase IB [Mycobacterium sp. ST-F2]
MRTRRVLPRRFGARHGGGGSHGHQGAGADAAGRRQYLYHAVWQQERTEEKFDRVLQLSTLLPDWRRQIAADLAGRGLQRDRVLALALHLIDRGFFRAGGEEYAQDNDSYGLATLRCEHIEVRADSVVFDYPAKSGVQRHLELADRQVVRVVRALRRGQGPSERLLWCRTDSGRSELHAEDLNTRFKELVGAEYSVKDLRTWHGTVLAAVGFAGAAPPDTKSALRRARTAVFREVAEQLGNTPAVARGSYVDPRVVTAYEKGSTIAAAVSRAQKRRNAAAAQAILEKATRSLIRRA